MNAPAEAPLAACPKSSPVLVARRRSLALLPPLLLPLLLLLLLVSPRLPADEKADEHLLLAEIALERGDIATGAREITLAAEASGSSATAERAAQVTFATGYDGYAIRAVGRWLELVPESPLANEIMGRLQLRRYRVDEAADYLSRALGSPEPLRDEIYLALAADLGQEKNAALVTRVLSRLAARDPLAPGLQLALGTAALRSGELDLAAAAVDSVILDAPDWREARLLAVRIRAARRDTDGALALLDDLAGADGGATDPMLETERIRILADAGRLAEARAVLANLDQLGEDQLVIRRTAAFLALQANDADGARQAFEALREDDAARTEALYYLGQLAATEGDLDRALDLFAGITAGPYLLPSQLARAENLVRAGRLEEALDGLGEFARRNPLAAFDITEARIRLLGGAGRTKEALAAYNEALVFKPDEPGLLVGRGTLLEQQGRIEPALKDMARAAAIAVDDASIINAYGYTLANRARRWREAWPLVRRAQELDPGSGAIQDSVGWVLFGLGRPEEARSHLEEAFRRIPDPEVASHLAEVHWSLGDRAAATDLLRATLVAYPDSKPARDTAARLLR